MSSSVMHKIKLLFTKRPFITNCVSFGSLCVGAQFSQQVIKKKILAVPQEPFDKPLLGRFAIMGTIILPPISHIWYRWLDGKFPGNSVHAAIRKLVLDQCVMGPLSLIIFFVGMSVLQFSHEPFRECREKFMETYQGSLFFWLPAQGINFAFIPPHYRIFYIGIITFIWVNILCFVERQKQ